MTAARLIRERLTNPGPLSYFAVAAATAIMVFAIAGYSCKSAPMPATYLPQDLSSPVASAPGSAVPVLASNGSASRPARQTVVIHSSGGVFRPNQISVHAGVPVDMVFTQGSGCTSYVRFDSLRLDASLESDLGVVRLPALAPGAYTFSCAHGTVAGIVVAE